MTGKDALDATHALAGFVTNAYNIHLGIITVLVGLVSTAAGSDAFDLTFSIKAALSVFYLFVSFSTLIAVEFLYRRINAMSEIAQILLEDELAGVVSINAQVRIVTEPVKGKIHRFLLPLLMVLIISGILLAPS